MATDVVVVLDHAALRHFTSWHGEIGHSFENIARSTVERQKAFCPVRSGRLRNSIDWHRTTWSKGISFVAGSPVEYALYVHQGTHQHTIKPKPPHKFLVFYIRGRKVVTKKVDHPGTRSQPFLKRGMIVALARQGIVIEFFR